MFKTLEKITALGRNALLPSASAVKSTAPSLAELSQRCEDIKATVTELEKVTAAHEATKLELAKAEVAVSEHAAIALQLREACTSMGIKTTDASTPTQMVSLMENSVKNTLRALNVSLK